MIAPSARIAIEGARFQSAVVPATVPTVASQTEESDRGQNGYVVITDTLSGKIVTVRYDNQARKLDVTNHDTGFPALKGPNKEE